MIDKDGSSLLFWSKLLFYLVLLSGCHSRPELSGKDIVFLWKEGRATGIAVALSRLDAGPIDPPATLLRVRLAGPGEQPATGGQAIGGQAIAGQYTTGQDTLVFQPLIPFTRGLSYDVLVRGQVITRIDIPVDTAVPRLVGLFPDQDTLPENLLKIHLVFSRPMAENHSIRYVRLLDARGDTLSHIFLDLPTELWNEEGTELTLWLDPGRIKRGLIPNQQWGPPLVKGRRYRLVVLSEWKDVEGVALDRSFVRDFIAGSRDTISPSPQNWKMIIPEKNTTHPLVVNCGEALDHALLKHAFLVVDSVRDPVKGSMEIDDRQRGCRFVPSDPWSKGRYELLIEGRLEDLAGNNLNRLFDVDLRARHVRRPTRDVFEREWRIE